MWVSFSTTSDPRAVASLCSSLIIRGCICFFSSNFSSLFKAKRLRSETDDELDEAEAELVRVLFPARYHAS